MIEFKQWVAPRAMLLLGACLVILATWMKPAHAAVVKDLRMGDNDGYLRMVLELDRPLNTEPSVAVAGSRLQIVLTGIDKVRTAPADRLHRGDLVRLDMSAASGRARIEAVYAFPPKDVKFFTLTGPHRLIIDAYRPPPQPADALPALLPEPKPASFPTRPQPSAECRSAAKTISASISGAIVGASLGRYDALAAKGLAVDRSQSDRLQQQLIVALIVVTTIIVILLFCLIWLGSGKGLRRPRAWLKDLPSTTDPDIEAIDMAIRGHLKRHDPM